MFSQNRGVDLLPYLNEQREIFRFIHKMYVLMTLSTGSRTGAT